MSLPDLPPRYRPLGLLGEGGMGAVYQVHDEQLGRTVALKMLHLEDDEEATARFLHEAQVSAQLEHPSIVPTYDAGRTPDGRLYFTMKEVHGHTLKVRMKQVHSISSREGRLGGPFRQVMQALQRAAEAVAYAHERGVIHRDLKPTNVMLGAFGEVLVLDWGLARLIGDLRADRTSVHTHRSGDDLSREGSITGTPGYLAPEQARGDLAAIGPATDAWALGVILYRCLAGRLPHAGRGMERLRRIATAQPVEPPRPPKQAWDVPEVLADLALRCLQSKPSDRPSASQIARDITAWLEGDDRLRAAREHVRRADAVLAEIDVARASARSWRVRAAALAPEAPDEADEEVLWPSWEAEDQAASLEEEADRLTLRRVRALQDALLHEPDLPEARRRLADHYRKEHASAEREGRTQDAHRLELELRTHDRGEHATYLQGRARLTLALARPTNVRLHRVADVHRRWDPVFDRDLGVTSSVDLSLHAGRWMLELVPIGGRAIRYPIKLDRGHHWALPSPLDVPNLKDPDDIAVLAGWAILGEDGDDYTLPLQRRMVDSFVMRRFPFTFAELRRLLRWLDAQQRPHDADALAPSRAGEAVYATRVDGMWEITPDPEGWTPSERHPVIYATYEVSTHIAAAEAERTGLPWRLPLEHEWEKAARGADGRAYPWGDHFHPSRAWLRHSWGPELPPPPPVGHVAGDVGIYGIRDLAGAYRDWVATDGSPVLKGGAWNATPELARAAFRVHPNAGACDGNMTFRLVRSLSR